MLVRATWVSAALLLLSIAACGDGVYNAGAKRVCSRIAECTGAEQPFCVDKWVNYSDYEGCHECLADLPCGNLAVVTSETATYGDLCMNCSACCAVDAGP